MGNGGQGGRTEQGANWWSWVIMGQPVMVMLSACPASRYTQVRVVCAGGGAANLGPASSKMSNKERKGEITDDKQKRLGGARLD